MKTEIRKIGRKPHTFKLTTSGVMLGSGGKLVVTMASGQKREMRLQRGLYPIMVKTVELGTTCKLVHGVWDDRTLR